MKQMLGTLHWIIAQQQTFPEITELYGPALGESTDLQSKVIEANKYFIRYASQYLVVSQVCEDTGPAWPCVVRVKRVEMSRSGQEHGARGRCLHGC